MFLNPDIPEQVIKRKTKIQALYVRAFPLVARHVGKTGGTLEEAKDIFHDALVIYMEKTAGSGIELTHSEASYLLGIARHLWSKKRNDSKLQVFERDLTKRSDLFEDDYQEIETSKLLELLKSTGQKCMELLSAFYYEKLDMRQVASRFGFSGSRSATVQKFKCLEKVKNTVKTKSLQYEDFME